MAKITPAYTKLGIKPAPEMASFSSQGPNTLNPDILKVLILSLHQESIAEIEWSCLGECVLEMAIAVVNF